MTVSFISETNKDGRLISETNKDGRLLFETASADPIKFGSNPDLDPKHLEK
jgi:hypothetical protein